jgi:hypothetical protein
VIINALAKQAVTVGEQHEKALALSEQRKGRNMNT